MAASPVHEGQAPFAAPGIEIECFTYYKVIGDSQSGKAPLLVIVSPWAWWARRWTRISPPLCPTLAAIWYSSDFLRPSGLCLLNPSPDTAGDKAFWTPELSTAQLDSLIDYLQLRDGPGSHFLGQSFGGMIGSAWARTQPRGLKRLVLASANAGKELSIRSMQLRIGGLPEAMQKAIYDAHESGDYTGEGYKAAIGEHMKGFLCRTDSLPEEMVIANRNLAEDTTVFSTMSGSSLLDHQSGSMFGWTAIPSLHKINVPTLVYNGEHDTSHNVSQIPFFEKIPRVRWTTIAGGGHMLQLEGDGRRERVLRLVGEFLTQGQ